MNLRGKSMIGLQRETQSGLKREISNLRVEGSNPFARSIFFNGFQELRSGQEVSCCLADSRRTRHAGITCQMSAIDETATLQRLVAGRGGLAIGINGIRPVPLASSCGVIW